MPECCRCGNEFDNTSPGVDRYYCPNYIKNERQSYDDIVRNCNWNIK